MSQTDKIVSKGMGVLKSTQARIEGLTGIFRQLTEEHGEVWALLKRLVDADAERRAELFPFVRKELLSHERAELSELYPLLSARIETRSIAEEHDQEAGEMESLLDELSDQPYDGPLWDSLVRRLADAVEHHIEEEEGEYFPVAQDVLGRDMTQALERRYLEKKQMLLQQLSQS